MDRVTATDREETGTPDEDATTVSSDWEHTEDDQHAFHGKKRRHPSIVTQMLGLITTGRFRQRIKNGNTIPLMYDMQGRSPTGGSMLKNRADKFPYGKSRFWRSRLWSSTGRLLVVVVVVALTVLGFLHLTESMLGGTPLLFGLNQRQNPPPDWGEIDYIRDVVANDPSEITRDVIPLPCHSHNDYWRRIPFYEALRYGCTSVEADVWLTDNSADPELHVGHSISSLTPERTLRSLYTDPLLNLLNAMNSNGNTSTTSSLNGVFQTSPDLSLVLLIDIKNHPHTTFAALQAHLEPFRAKKYLTTHNGTALIRGPLTIVMTGSTPYDSILAQNASSRDIFFDAPLAELSTPLSSNPPAKETYNDYNTTTSLYASASLAQTLGSFLPFSLLPGKPSESQLTRIRSVVTAAHARGLKVRWWDTPAWPRARRERVWRILMQEGADVLNVDDLKAARGWSGW